MVIFCSAIFVLEYCKAPLRAPFTLFATSVLKAPTDLENNCIGGLNFLGTPTSVTSNSLKELITDEAFVLIVAAIASNWLV